MYDTSPIEVNPYNFRTVQTLNMPMVQMPECTGTTYFIKAGDTLYSISMSFGIPAEDILYRNPTLDPYKLIPGKGICIPWISSSKQHFFW